jgi:hypothetical protein
MTHVSPLARVFKGDRADISLCIDIENSVLIEIPGLDDVAVAELNVERVWIIEILNFHTLYPRSKNAL